MELENMKCVIGVLDYTCHLYLLGMPHYTIVQIPTSRLLEDAHQPR